MCSPRASRVGADPSLTGAFTWIGWDDKIDSAGLKLIPAETNPIDTVWDKEGTRKVSPQYLITILI